MQKKYHQRWNTWNPDWPAELRHLGSGISLTPVLYSARANDVRLIEASTGFTFGPRSIDGRTVSFSTLHEDTEIRWQYEFENDSCLLIDWQVLRFGEWGLRYWISIGVGGPLGSSFHYDQLCGVLQATAPGPSKYSVRAAKDPLLVTFHDDIDGLCHEFRERGYFYLGSRGTEGLFAALRFNLEEAPSMRIAVADTQIERPQIPTANNASGNEPADDPLQNSLQAIYDVLAWNHVYDRINSRPYTVLTRNWNSQKFGGFGVWMNDVLYHAMLWSFFDDEPARQNIAAVFDGQTEAGNFPCLITGNDAWLDRSQPPIAGLVIWRLRQSGASRDWLASTYPALIRNYNWWWQHRTLADTGLLAFGTSLDVGDGLYKGTKLAAKDESSMDNSPIHDPANYNAKTGLLEACDVGLNSLHALDGEIIAALAEELGYKEDARRLRDRVRDHQQRIGEWLWDSKRGVFANRLLDGQFVDALAPTSFYPLAAGAASSSQARELVQKYLAPVEFFGGEFVLPSVSRSDPAFGDNRYWRGRIWPPLNYWVYQGLRRYQYFNEASNLAHAGQRLFDKNWRNRQCGENYNALTGEITDQPDADPFYTWGLLLPALTIAEVIDHSPWSGFCIKPSLVRDRFGPIRTRFGRITIEQAESHWRVLRDGHLWLTGNVSGRINGLNAAPGQISFEMSSSDRKQWIEIANVTIVEARCNTQPLQMENKKIHLPALDKPHQVVLRWR